MRKRSLGIVLLAALAASGFNAATAGNTFTNTTNVAGYGENTVTGTTVSKINYSTLSTDATKLASVVFTAKTDITGFAAKMTLKNSTGVAIGASPYSCVLGTWDVLLSEITVTCNTPDNPAVSTIASTGLTVTQ
jgi:hypothetical protein